MIIKLSKQVGSFAENKDVAKRIRLEEIIPALQEGKEVTIDFSNVDGATQSFVHALISDVIRQLGVDILEKIKFKACNETIEKIITIVYDYMQESER